MRNNLKYFTFLFIFFVVVAVGSIMILNGSGSVFDRSANTIGADQSVLSDTIIGTEPKNDETMEEAVASKENDIDTSDVEAALEGLNAAQEASVEVSEPVMEETEPVVEVTEPTVEETEPVAEESTETEEKEDSEVLESGDGDLSSKAPLEVKFYTYKISTEGLPLRLRDEPHLEANVITKINNGSHGYILKPGNVWCKVYTANGKMGYLATEYLTVVEVKKEDFPAEIQDKVEAPDEALGSAFEVKG